MANIMFEQKARPCCPAKSTFTKEQKKHKQKIDLVVCGIKVDDVDRPACGINIKIENYNILTAGTFCVISCNHSAAGDCASPGCSWSKVDRVSWDKRDELLLIH